MEQTYAVELTKAQLDRLKRHLEIFLKEPNEWFPEEDEKLKEILEAVEFTISQKDIPF